MNEQELYRKIEKYVDNAFINQRNKMSEKLNEWTSKNGEITPECVANIVVDTNNVMLKQLLFELARDFKFIN